MKPNRRKLVRNSFMAIVTGTSALALQACGEGDQAGGNNSARESKESGGNSDSDS